MSITNLLRPLPGIGHAMNVREYAINTFSSDTEPSDNFAIRGSKTFANSLIRCTSYSIPYITYASWPYVMLASQYVNAGLAVAKGAYAGYSYYQGYTENNDDKKEQAKKIALQAGAHGLFAYGDYLSTFMSAQSVVPIITAYVGVGAVTDLLGKSKQIHNKWFNNENKYVEDDEDSDSGVSSSGEEDPDFSVSRSVENDYDYDSGSASDDDRPLIREESDSEDLEHYSDGGEGEERGSLFSSFRGSVHGLLRSFTTAHRDDHSEAIYDDGDDMEMVTSEDSDRDSSIDDDGAPSPLGASFDGASSSGFSRRSQRPKSVSPKGAVVPKNTDYSDRSFHSPIGNLPGFGMNLRRRG